MNRENTTGRARDTTGKTLDLKAFMRVSLHNSTKGAGSKKSSDASIANADRRWKLQLKYGLGKELPALATPPGKKIKK